VLAGESVIRGTRIAARHVADLIRRGASQAEVREDLELSDAQIEAALVFDRTTPRAGWREQGRRALTLLDQI